MATLKENTEELVKIRRRQLKEAWGALRLVRELPFELQVLDAEAGIGYYDSVLYINIHQFRNKDIDILKACKAMGIQELTTKFSGPDNWYADGKFSLPKINGEDRIVRVHLSGLPNPPNCRIEEYKEEITRYKAICPETGEEL